MNMKIAFSLIAFFLFGALAYAECCYDESVCIENMQEAECIGSGMIWTPDSCLHVSECETSYEKMQIPDSDGDGYTVNDGDCDDNNLNIYPNAAELCNSIDDDCDGEVDENCGGFSFVTGAAQVPEFSTIGIIVVLAGFAALAWYVRKNK
jgi:hypothetical protein